MRNAVVLRRTAPAEMSRGGIIIPGVAQEVALEGVVVAVGPGEWRTDDPTRRQPMTVEVGQTVLFGKHCGTEKVIDVGRGPEKLLVIVEHELLGVVEE